MTKQFCGKSLILNYRQTYSTILKQLELQCKNFCYKNNLVKNKTDVQKTKAQTNRFNQLMWSHLKKKKLLKMNVTKFKFYQNI